MCGIFEAEVCAAPYTPRSAAAAHGVTEMRPLRGQTLELEHHIYGVRAAYVRSLGLAAHGTAPEMLHLSYNKVGIVGLAVHEHSLTSRTLLYIGTSSLGLYAVFKPVLSYKVQLHFGTKYWADLVNEE